MPRALTEQEKCAQCRRLLEKGKGVVLSYGVKKVSVDDIARAAGMAKGTFYQHFESKENYLYALIEKIHRETFSWAEQTLSGMLSQGGELRTIARDFMQALFTLPEMGFFIQNEAEISLLFGAAVNSELHSFKQMEINLFAQILHLFGTDTKTVRPGVVHNYIHVLFLMRSSDYMTEDDLQETVDLIMDSLITYVFGGAL